MSESVNDKVKQLLTAWALWQRELSGVGIGSSSVAVHAKLPGGGGGISPEPSPEVQQVELVLGHVKQMMPMYWRVIRIEYMAKLTNNEAADELRISVASWKVLRGKAETYVAACIDYAAVVREQQVLTG